MQTALSFLDRVKNGEHLVADGATGTNLLQRGLPRGVTAEAWMLQKPEEIVRLHADFIQSGADILLTCTFNGGPLRLKASGLAGKTEEVNRRAVELARQAITQSDVERVVYIGGSLGPAGGLLKPYGPLEPEMVFENYAEQAKSLQDSGVDFFVIETQFDLNEASQAVQAVRKVSSLPLVCSFSYDRGLRTMMGVKPAQMAETIGSLAVDMLGVNCGRSLKENLEALKQLREASKLPLWFKPNAGLPEVDSQGNSVYSISPQEMGTHLVESLAIGAQVIGGCCGTSPAHLSSIADSIKSH